VEACVAELTPGAAELTPDAAEPMVGVAEFTTVAAQRPGPSAETPRRLEDTLHPAARAARARAHSAATAMAEKPGAMRHVEAPAWVAERVAAEELAVAAVLAAVVADIGNHRRDRET